MSTSDRYDPVTAVILLIGALVFLPWLKMGFGFGGMMGGGMMGGYGGTTGWWPFLGSLVQVAILLALLGGGFLLIKRRTVDPSASSSALAELRLAYASDDLSDEDFERRRAILKQRD